MPEVKTCFIGPFAPPYNGDGVKNTTLKEGFDRLGVQSIEYFDTIRRGKGLVRFSLELLQLVLTSKQIMLSLNKNGRFVLLPLTWVACLFGKKALLFVVGGTYHQQLERLPVLLRRLYVAFLNRLDFVFVETEAMHEALVRFGVTSAHVLYNPRKDDGVRWQLGEQNRNRIVFLSRVTPTKGIGFLMDAVEALNAQGHSIRLEVYGPVDPAYEAEFSRRVNGRAFFAYKGVVEPTEVQAVLSRYHAFVLPTFHDGEGLPGALVEAGFVGTPAILTDFNAIPEYVQDHVSALLVRPRDADDLRLKLDALLGDDQLARVLSSGIKMAVRPFALDNVMLQVNQFIRCRSWVT